MFGMLWLLLHALALVAEGGVSSGSGEVAGGNGNGGNNNNNNNGGGGGGGRGVAGVNGIGLAPNVLQPLNTAAFQVVPVGGGSFFIQPVGNAPPPQVPQVPRAPVQQQLVTFGAPFQQGGAGGFFLGQQGAAHLIPLQALGRRAQAPGAAGGLPLYTLLSQGGNLVGGPQWPIVLQGQQLQLVPLNQQNQNQPLGGGGVGVAAGGRARLRRSLAAHPRGRAHVMPATPTAPGTPTAPATPATPRTPAGGEEESSGLDTEEQITN